MKLAKAKEYFELGVITSMSAVSLGAAGGWILCVESKSNAWGNTLQTALGEDKVYATLDSLNRDVERIIGSQPDTWAYRL
jgi:hypothetical protein